MNFDKKPSIIFAGTPEFAETILLALIEAEFPILAVYTRQDKPAGRGQKLLASPVKQAALAHLIPVIQPKTLRDPTAQAELAAFQADLMIVAAYGLILPQAVLDLPRLGCINVHGSLLPRWRGAAPIQRAVLTGDSETGITIMQMDAGLDTGDMLHKHVCPILDEDTSGSLHDKLASIGAIALLDALEKLQQGNLVAEKQDEAQATYAHKLEKDEAKIDWYSSAETIGRQVRAFNPWPIAHTTLDDKILRIWQTVVLTETTHALPGTILHVDKKGLDIATGHGILRILMMQLPNQKVLSVADILNGHPTLLNNNKALV
ncbi:MAG: methionyl-tRNA formyltransferase [Legionellales bacterium]|nr:methionyl-tRNA formyltransferase [Legionellales bacterium]